MSLEYVRFGMARIARSNRPGSRRAGQYAHSQLHYLKKIIETNRIEHTCWSSRQRTVTKVCACDVGELLRVTFRIVEVRAAGDWQWTLLAVSH